MIEVQSLKRWILASDLNLPTYYLSDISIKEIKDNPEVLFKVLQAGEAQQPAGHTHQCHHPAFHQTSLIMLMLHHKKFQWVKNDAHCKVGIMVTKKEI